MLVVGGVDSSKTNRQGKAPFDDVLPMSRTCANAKGATKAPFALWISALAHFAVTALQLQSFRVVTRGSGALPRGAAEPAYQAASRLAPSWNCSSSVEPFSAVVELCPPWMVWVTVSK